MSKYPPMKDLLSNQRRRSRRRGRGPRRMLIVLVLLACAGLWWWYDADDSDEDARDVHEVALHAAGVAVADSVRAARAPLDVEETGDLGTSKRDEELTAVFADGQEVAMRGVLEQDQSVYVALEARNLSPAAIHKVVSATGDEFNFRRSRPGDEWYVEADADGSITLFRYQTSPEDIWETRRTSNGEYSCEKIEVPVKVREEVIGGRVTSSLWQTLVDMGEEGLLIHQFADIFAYTIDFNTGTRPGDQFGMVFEKVYLDGEFLRYGKILAGVYIGRDGVNYGFYYEADDDEVGYYDEEGENLRRQFLRSPLATVRVTSTFGKRFHPVLKQMKMHNGVDYGAPIGTPIRAVADGTVTFAGWKGANGKLIAIKHANGYRTYYAHLSKVMVRRGQRVTQKTIIGHVGNTGRSTAPHLHFGMKRHGKYVDPRKTDFAKGEPLKGEEKTRYIEQVATPFKDKLDEAIEASAAKRSPRPAALDEQPSISAD